jgi:hypothetical protein
MCKSITGTNRTSRSISITIWLTRELEVTAMNLHGGDVDFVDEENQSIYLEKVYFGKHLEASGVVKKNDEVCCKGEKIKKQRTKEVQHYRWN